MRPIQRLIGRVRHPMAERHARGKGIEVLAAELEASGRALDARIAGKLDTSGNREALAHWIGIERWGQRRLHVTLGEPFLQDEHHSYRPDMGEGLTALQRALAETRAETVALARRLQKEGVDPTTTVPHNDLGRLSVAGWLAYLRQHPEQEARGRLRG
ncbi:MAG: hypothetical protein U5K81_11550 [Trueperaceae bacterium]|nr:hypothetical protein [Trueperaceae bacterium]